MTNAMNNSLIHDPADRQAWTRREWLMFAFVFAVALAARLWRLGDQSVWYDEYITVAFTREPGLLACLREQLKWDWHMTPVYHILQYYWAQLVGQSIPGIRLLSVLFSMGTLTVLYLFARRLFGTGAALLSASFFALSPFHIFHAQGIRNYSLMAFFGLVSMYAFVRAFDGGGRRWWLLNGAANALLMWTHLFGTTLLISQGLCLVLSRWRVWRQMLWWGCAHALLVAPLGLWVLSLKGGIGAPEAVPPGWSALFRDLFRRESSYIEWVMGALTPALQAKYLPSWTQLLLRYEADVLGVLAWLLAASLPLLVVCAIWRSRADGASTWRRFEQPFCLILWLVVPGAVLLALAHVAQRVVFQERFTIFSSPALYLIAAGAVSGIPWRLARILAGIVLVTLFAFQALLGTTLNVRQDYLGASRSIAAERQPDDVVCALGMYTHFLLDFNRPAKDYPLMKVDTLDALMQATDVTLARGGIFWAVVTSVPRQCGGPPDVSGVAESYQRYLQARDIACQERAFLGMQHVHVFRCHAGDGFANIDDPESVSRLLATVRLHPDDEALRNRWLAVAHETGGGAALIKEYRRALESAPEDAQVRARLGTLLVDIGEIEEGIAECRRAIEADPYLVEAYDTIDRCLLEGGDNARRVQVWRDAATKNPDIPRPRFLLAVALEASGDLDGAIDAYRAAAQRAPTDAAMQAGLGMALMRAGNPGEAVDAMRVALAINPDIDYLRVALVDALTAIGDAHAAAIEAEECRRRGIVLPARPQ